ncbi:hypothetical protein IMZ48_46980 [Candidatus Bathyarchaeota archaeon]|nr:hypothetical protein [Candidatus Bathyarchaeota archaeon]
MAAPSHVEWQCRGCTERRMTTLCASSITQYHHLSSSIIVDFDVLMPPLPESEIKGGEETPSTS